MVEVVTCPDRSTLERLLAGLMPDDAAADLEQHLLGCASCCQAVRELLPAATQYSLSVAARLAAKLSEEQAVREVASRVATLRLPDRSAPNMETLASASESTGQADDFGKLLGPPEAPDEIGRFGGYRVLRLLGAGGMGLVWEAEDPHLRRHVAIKVMKPQFANQAEHRERFLREARAAAAIDNSHIVTVYQVGEHRGVPFLAMQLLRGETLEDLLQRERQLPQAECLRIGRQMAEALAVAHRRGLIHRDVKPANTWLESDGGWVKLVDFGLAHAVEDDTHLTQSGMILGTPAFMSPEQARGEPVSPRSDLFSLGAVLYRMATGAGPFRGPSTLAVLTSLALHTPEAPRQINSDVSQELSDLIMRLLAKDPAERPQSAEAVVAAIREIEERSPKSEVQSPKSDAAEAERARHRDGDTPRRPRWPRLVFAAAGAAALLLAGITVIIRDKDGNIIGEASYPAGHSAEVIRTDDLAPTVIPEPPPLDAWLKGRKILTVSQDGGGQFKTIQAALSALQPGQAVEILDRGPYRETLVTAVQDSGLFSRAGAVIELAGKRSPIWEKDAADNQFFENLDGFRLSGLTFVAKDLSQHEPANPWLMLAVAGDVLVEGCRFIGGEPNNGNVGVLVYWNNTGKAESTCVVRECCFEAALNFGFNVAARERKQRALVERNWFRSVPQEAPLSVRGAGDALIVRDNIADGPRPGVMHLLDVDGMDRLEIYNNSFLAGRVRFFGRLQVTTALVRNNYFSQGIEAEEKAAPGKNPFKGWDTSGNVYLQAPAGVQELPLAASDQVQQPEFLSRHPTDPRYLRVASASGEPRRGAGDARRDYVGALPPGPAPKDGDWFTNWIKAAPTLHGGEAIANGEVGHKTQDRLVAEWVHSQRGSVGGGTATASWVNVGPDDPLPDGDFSLGAVGLEGPIADADLVRLNGLKHLLVLSLSRSSVGDQGIANLGNLPELSCLYMGQTNLGDAGLRDLARRFPEVRVLHAGETKITDAGVPALLAWKNLLELGLDNLAITDRSIETLAKLKYLRAAYLGRTSITRSGVERLHAARPYCKIVSDFGTIDEPPIEGAASLRFNGINDYVDIPTLRYEARRPITIEASVRREPQLHEEVALVSNLMTLEGPPGAALGWRAGSGWSFAVKTQEYRAAAMDEPEIAPTQLAGVWDGRRLTLYFDGKQVASSDQAELADGGKPSGHFVIGAAKYIDGQQHFTPFMGVVDEVRISDVARYDGDYQPRSRLETDDHTLALYHFDEGEGQVLHDASGHGHDGKIVGGTWVKVSSADSAKVAPALRDGSASRLPTASDSPPSLDEWLKGRKILTVSQDGRAKFKTIQAALDALEPGQAVEVLDRGPYRETLAFGGQKDVGLFTRAGTTVVSGAKRKSFFEGDTVKVHNLSFVNGFRLCGISFVADANDLTDVPDGAPWITLGLSGDALIESCHFAGGRPKVEMLVHWRPEAPPGTACTVRECLFDSGITINLHGKQGRAIATVEHNWFRSSNGYFPLYIDGSGERTVIRHNVFDAREKAALAFQDTGRTEHLEVSNNTVLGWVNFGATDPAHQELFAPTKAIVRNNLFHESVSCKDQPGRLNAAAQGWQIGNNAFAKPPDTANQLAPTPADFISQPKFLSRDPTDPDYLRIVPGSDEAHRGAGGDLPDYIGALPPGPAPKDGDWLTHWIKGGWAPPTIESTVGSAHPTLSEPPPLDEWLKDRKVLTVSQDGKGQFQTIQAALDALRNGQVVEVLDRGPYRETLHFHDHRDAGLIGRVGTVVEFTGKRGPAWDKDPANDHAFGNLRGFRLSGFSFTAGELQDRPADVGWIGFGLNGDLVIEDCHFVDRRPHMGGLVIYWYATAPQGAICRIRRCLFETSVTVNVSGDGPRARAIVEQNWFKGTSFMVHGNGKHVVVRQNVFDGENLFGLSLLETARLGRLEIYNNTFLSRIFAHNELPATGVTLRNNLLLFQGIVAGPAGAASLPAAAQGWEVSHNEYSVEPELAYEFPKAARDFVARPKFLSDEPSDRDYLRIAAESEEAHRGAGGDWPAYLGALPPGPAPAEGDWLTRWIEAK
jgi:hypothetical protein